ncbi:formylmethanofuran dehydrogenase subunit E family protein [Salidesulfovibrio onnuriiensis]|uniref:formylmethanofuran dehydrogenase subunit E family protein n=1 Tax=Salidesulfovibrio onnuriiensis TaxID=2583823 RepID=UPI0011CB689C|nr:formylmethanofuran dehydrogenase subunit E family protein [Salidesulfovibrio onnuriiensis]
MQKRFVLFAFLVLSVVLCGASAARAHGGFDARDAVCFKTYPTDPALFNDVVGPYVQKIIERHGLEEWKATLLTNEMHRHLGLWSIIGAKMGVRAREVLDAPFDQLRVVSFAGRTPPFSCLNDGIQVSTGASLGRGTINVADMAVPEAQFFHDDKGLFMKPKPEIVKAVRGTIKELSKAYGFQSEEYFRQLEKVSVKYWLVWDRSTMFEERPMP